MEKNKQINFKDLSWLLKIGIIGGLTWVILFLLGFLMGMFGAI